MASVAASTVCSRLQDVMPHYQYQVLSSLDLQFWLGLLLLLVEQRSIFVDSSRCAKELTGWMQVSEGRRL